MGAEWPSFLELVDGFFSSPKGGTDGILQNKKA